MSRPIIPSSIFWSETEDGVVVVDPVNGDVRAFNGVGSDVWKLISQQQTLAEIEAGVVAVYDVSAEIAKADVAAFIAELDKRDLIKWTE
ncbi:MAG: PqqD family protein [Candidatus Promineifilaceae bacterium]